MRTMTRRWLLLAALLLVVPAALGQQCPGHVPVQGAPPPAPLPVFPADNWWNVDIAAAPVDPASASYIAFINNGGTRKLHPDFGGEESPGSTAIYGIPYAIVDGSQSKKSVVFDYDDESDGVGRAFYPIPAEAISQTHWVEGGAPGNIDQRDDGDRHLLVIDCTNRSLYELFNVWYSGAEQQWHAGSGAFFDMGRNDRRPDGWTSADAAGLAIFPGLVRYDEAANTALNDLGHAVRVTVRATNGYVFPASHRAGSTAGALPMGARLRLKRNVGGSDPATRTSDPVARRIFRAMQKYGLIVADNGSDMYISGSFDVRWDNDSLNPAFSTLSASDFEIIQLGWKPTTSAVVLTAVSASPNPVQGGQPSTGKVTLSAPALSGGAHVVLSSASPAFSVPAGVTVPQGAGSATFTITTVPSSVAASGTLSATYAGTTRTTALTVNATPAATLSIDDASMKEGDSGSKSLVFNIHLSQVLPNAVGYNIATSNDTAIAGKDYAARALTGQTIPAGSTSGSFAVTIYGDKAFDGTNRFHVTLAAISGASPGDTVAVGTIIDDDAPRMSTPLPPQRVQEVSPPAGIASADAMDGCTRNDCAIDAGASRIATARRVVVRTWFRWWWSLETFWARIVRSDD